MCVVCVCVCGGVVNFEHFEVCGFAFVRCFYCFVCGSFFSPPLISSYIVFLKGLVPRGARRSKHRSQLRVRPGQHRRHSPRGGSSSGSCGTAAAGGGGGL